MRLGRRRKLQAASAVVTGRAACDPLLRGDSWIEAAHVCVCRNDRSPRDRVTIFDHKSLIAESARVLCTLICALINPAINHISLFVLPPFDCARRNLLYVLLETP